MFFFRSSKIVLDCFTRESRVYEYSKPDKAIKFLPSWWKQIPKGIYVDPLHLTPTIRTCVGFADLYKRGIVIPMWSDLAVALGPQGTDLIRWQFADHISEAGPHPEVQTGGQVDYKDTQHLKLFSPWTLRTKEDIYWHWNDVFWDKKSYDYRVLPAVVSFTHQRATNINIFFKRKSEEYVLDFKLGQPMVHLTPLTEKKIEVRHHLVSPDEYHRILTERGTLCFTNSYVKQKQHLEKVRGK